MTGSHEKFESELSELRGKLKTDGEISSATSEQQNTQERTQDEQVCHVVATERDKTEAGSANKSTSTLNQLNDILNEELNTFCERLSLVQKTLNKENTKQLKNDQKASTSENITDQEDNEDSRLTRTQQTDQVNEYREDSSSRILKETEELRGRLSEVLTPFVSSAAVESKYATWINPKHLEFWDFLFKAWDSLKNARKFLIRTSKNP